MIQGFLEIIGVLVVVLVALLGAYWKFLKIASSNKVQYQQDAITLRSIVVSSELVPQIISLIEKVETERKQSPNEKVEQILSRSTFAYPLEFIARIMSKINDIDTLYLKTIKYAFRCAYDMLIAAILPALTIIWLFLNVYLEYFNVYFGYYLLLTLFGAALISTKIIYDVLGYVKVIRQFIDKDNEIRLGRSMI